MNEEQILMELFRRSGEAEDLPGLMNSLEMAERFHLLLCGLFTAETLAQRRRERTRLAEFLETLGVQLFRVVRRSEMENPFLEDVRTNGLPSAKDCEYGMKWPIPIWLSGILYSFNALENLADSNRPEVVPVLVNLVSNLVYFLHGLQFAEERGWNLRFCEGVPTGYPIYPEKEASDGPQ